MIYRFVYYFFGLFPDLKRKFWKFWYTIFAKKVKNPDLRFMNYGFLDDGFSPDLSEDDEKERYPIQLYHHVAQQIELEGKQVLEIGSGRGGGASYIAKTFNPSHIRGLDISDAAVDLCNNFYTQENLDFSVGDAENLPFKENSFDVVINIESSHCYGDMNCFLSEVRRVLRPDGYFLFADLRRTKLLDKLNSSFLETGFVKVKYQDITTNIVNSLDLMSKKRSRNIAEVTPKLFRNIVESFAGVKGSKVYKSFTSSYLSYISASFRIDK